MQCYSDSKAPAWSISIYKRPQQKLQILQNKAVRFMLNLSPRVHIGQVELNKVGFLNTYDRVQQLECVQYTVYNGTASMYLCQNFTTVLSEHHYPTRQAQLNL